MKKTASLWAVAMTVFAFAACEKADLITSEAETITASKKGGVVTAVTSFGGQATGLNAIVVNTQSTIVTSNQTILAQTALLPTTGGSLQAGAAPATIPGVFSADALTASITGSGDRSVSQAAATNVSITIGGNVITATSVQSSATAVCGPLLSGNAVVENLVVNGTPITITGAPNQSIFLPGGGMILINQQSISKKGKVGSITVIGLHIILPYGSIIDVASTKAEIKC
jgi:hypothetical protein